MYSGFLSPEVFAFFTMNKIRTAVIPPETTPPIDRIFVKEKKPEKLIMR